MILFWFSVFWFFRFSHTVWLEIEDDSSSSNRTIHHPRNMQQAEQQLQGQGQGQGQELEREVIPQALPALPRPPPPPPPPQHPSRRLPREQLPFVASCGIQVLRTRGRGRGRCRGSYTCNTRRKCVFEHSEAQAGHPGGDTGKVSPLGQRSHAQIPGQHGPIRPGPPKLRPPEGAAAAEAAPGPGKVEHHPHPAPDAHAESGRHAHPLLLTLLP